jgi:plastocyanin domain-containing protein
MARKRALQRSEDEVANNKVVIGIAAVILLAIVIFSVKSMLSGAPANSAPVTPTTQAQNGEILLSWGKFNYVPEVITVKKGEPVRIRADLKRLTGCYQSFVVPDLGIQKYFSESDDVVEFTPTKAGTFTFTCRMGMGRGTLVVQ